MCCDWLQEFILTELLYFPILILFPILIKPVSALLVSYKPITISSNHAPFPKKKKQKKPRKMLFHVLAHLPVKSPRMSELEEM